MKVSCHKVRFTIGVDFDGADVDMVYSEMVARGVQTIVPGILCGPYNHKVKGNRTPTEATVDFAIHWLAGYVDRNDMCTTTSKWDTDYRAPMISAKTEDGMEYSTWPKVTTELEEIGIDVVSWNGLMMGCCSLECEVPFEKYSPELVSKANVIVHKIMKRFVKYYKEKKSSEKRTAKSQG